MNTRVALFAAGMAAIAAIGINGTATAAPEYPVDEAGYVAALEGHTASMTADEVVEAGYAVCDLIADAGVDGAYDYYAGNSYADLLIDATIDNLCGEHASELAEYKGE